MVCREGAVESTLQLLGIESRASSLKCLGSKNNNGSQPPTGSFASLTLPQT